MSHITPKKYFCARKYGNITFKWHKRIKKSFVSADVLNDLAVDVAAELFVCSSGSREGEGCKLLFALPLIRIN